MKRRQFIHRAGLGAFAIGMDRAAGATSESDAVWLKEIDAMPSLAEAYREAFPIGVSLKGLGLGGYSPEEEALIARQFNF